MKSKNLSKKLSFKKATIAHLGKTDTALLKGGRFAAYEKTTADLAAFGATGCIHDTTCDNSNCPVETCTCIPANYMAR